MWQKARMKPFSNPLLSLDVKPIPLLLIIITDFRQIQKNVGQNYRKFEQKQRKTVYYLQNFKPPYLPGKQEIQNNLFDSISSLNKLFNDTTHKTLR